MCEHKMGSDAFDLINEYQRFGGTCCLHFYPEEGRAGFFEKLVSTYQYQNIAFQKTLILKCWGINEQMCLKFSTLKVDCCSYKLALYMPGDS
jgi:hypothetical protein